MTSIFETIKACRICSSLNLKEILDLGKQPPANTLCSTEREVPPPIPLRLLFCDECKIAQLGESVDPNYLFSRYIWVTGTSKTALEYSFNFAKEALNRSLGRSSFVIEIASNDGTFLKRFQEQGCLVLGVDPAKNLAQTATNGGIPTVDKFFNQELARDILKNRGAADIVIARNVIPHVKEIHSVIEGISILLDEKGTGIIEFHDSNLIQDELQYDYIYHEHLFYYSLDSMSNLLSRYGLKIYDISRSPISGGSWVIYFSKTHKEKSSTLMHAEKEERSSGVNTLENWLLFSKNAKKFKLKLRNIIFTSKDKILAYGASARSSTLLNFCGINHNHITAIIDKNPHKHGMFTPGSKIPIISFEEGMNHLKEQQRILLLAWNFQEEVIKDLRNSAYKGQFIIPLPREPHIL